MYKVQILKLKIKIHTLGCAAVTLAGARCVGVWWMATRCVLETSRGPHPVWGQHPRASGKIGLWRSSSALQTVQWMPQKARAPCWPLWWKSWGLLPRKLMCHNYNKNTKSVCSNHNLLYTRNIPIANNNQVVYLPYIVPPTYMCA